MESKADKNSLGFNDLAAAAKCKNICPERLIWRGRLAGISEGPR